MVLVILTEIYNMVLVILTDRAQNYGKPKSKSGKRHYKTKVKVFCLINKNPLYCAL